MTDDNRRARQQNGTPGTVPFSDWSAPNGEIIQGGSLLDVHGPIFFAALSVVMLKLIPELGEAIGAVNNADDIKSVMQRHVRWCASTYVQSIISHLTYRLPQDEPYVREGQANIPHGLAVVFLN